VTPTQARANAINASRTITRKANIALYLNAASGMCALRRANRKRRSSCLAPIDEVLRYEKQD
jgi:hypothetical protein